MAIRTFSQAQMFFLSMILCTPMKTTIIKWIFTLLVPVFFLVACSKDDYDEPNGVKIRFQAKSTLKSSADTVLINEAYIGIADIDFVQAGNRDTSGLEKIVHEGPYVVDILKGTITPGIRWIFVKPGQYRQIKLSAQNVLPGGNSIIVKGTIRPSDRSGEIPFEFTARDDYDLKITNETGVAVRNGENVSLVVLFDLVNLFNGIDLNPLKQSSDGVLIFTDNEHKNVTESMIARMELLSTFRIDDGRVSEPEDEDDEPSDEDKETDQENTGDGNDNDNDGDNSGGNNEDEDDDREDSSDQDEDSAGNDDNDQEDDKGDDSGQEDDEADEDKGEDEDNDGGNQPGNGAGNDGQNGNNGNGNNNGNGGQSGNVDDDNEDDDGSTGDDSDNNDKDDGEGQENDDSDEDKGENDDKDNDNQPGNGSGNNGQNGNNGNGNNNGNGGQGGNTDDENEDDNQSGNDSENDGQEDNDENDSSSGSGDNDGSSKNDGSSPGNSGNAPGNNGGKK